MQTRPEKQQKQEAFNIFNITAGQEYIHKTKKKRLKLQRLKGRTVPSD
jgi:hypothetical protein